MIKLKRLVYNCLLLFILLTGYSCEDFLSYSENVLMTEEVAIKHINDAAAVGFYAYKFIKDDFRGGMRASACDEAVFARPSYIQTYYDNSWSPFKLIDKRWAELYEGIYACNNFLEVAADLTFENQATTQGFADKYKNYKSLKHEIIVLRAYFYFELAKRYNNVPLVTKMLNTDEANTVSPTSGKEIFKWVASQCNKEYEKMNEDFKESAIYNNQESRISKYFAKALESRALLYAASPLFNNGTYDKASLKGSAKASLELIKAKEEAGVDISKIDYYNLWNSINNTHYQNPEILGYKFIGKNNSFEKENFPVSFAGGNSGNCPTQNLVDAYDMQKGKTYDPENPYQNRDGRLAKTIVFNGQKWAYNKTVDVSYNGADGLPLKNATPTGYYLRKFAMKNTDLNAQNETSHTKIWIIFRLAEAYTNYAEAMAILYGPNGTDGILDRSAVESLNKVRRRVGNNVADIPDNLSTDEFLATLKKEKFVEFAFEDHRFWDIRRWQIGDQTNRIHVMEVTKKNGKIVYTKKKNAFVRDWQDKYYFYPIAHSEVMINKNIVQNPGW